MALILEKQIPRPSPNPYPGTEIFTQKGAVGSWRLWRSQMYTVTLSIDRMQEYYEGEMSHYCVNTGRFEPLSQESSSVLSQWLPDQIENLSCREASCTIPRQETQEFRVFLCQEQKLQTFVIQDDFWKD